MSDYIVRAVAAQGYVRALACTTRDTAEYARKAHNTTPVVSAALGRLLSAGAMMGSMMKGDDDLITIRINGDGPMQGAIVTADSTGHVKGYPYNPMVIIPPKYAGKLDVGGAVGHGTITVISDIGLKEPYVGQVDLISGEIAEDIANYYVVSEQIPTSVALGVLVDRDTTINCSGGFIVQLMPDCPDDIASKLQEKISGMDTMTNMLHSGMTPEDILREALGDMELEITETLPCGFVCNCNRDRVERALISTGEKELSDMIDEGKSIEVNCHFCNKAYNFSVSELREILKKARQ